MKLSTAMAKGIKLRPTKCTGEFFEGSKSACALGAVYVGTFNKTKIDGVCALAELEERYPELCSTHLNPADVRSQLLEDIIIELNDDHDWDRSEIVKWLKKEKL